MSTDEIEGHIQAIQDQKSKIIRLAYENSHKIRQSISKNSEKIKEGALKIIQETDPQLTEEGVQKITKKGKIYFRSLKAFNILIHFIDQQFSEFHVPDSSNDLSSSELSQFIRNLSKLLNEVNREQAIADKVMGLDFMLKKRAIYVPIGKINSDLNKLRNLQKEEYRVVKALEDLENLKTDIEDLLLKISSTEKELEDLNSTLQLLEKQQEDMEKEISKLHDNPLIKEARQRGIRMTELEIKLGRHLNSFKKIFKKYAREIQRGTISGDFGLVNTALSYEEDPVKSFLKENENNSEIIALLEELIKVGISELKLKQKDINNIKHELTFITEKKLDNLKNEWHESFNMIKKDGESSEFKLINSDLLTKEDELLELKNMIISNEENINLKTKELSLLSESLDERRKRAKDITDEILLDNVL